MKKQNLLLFTSLLLLTSCAKPELYYKDTFFMNDDLVLRSPSASLNEASEDDKFFSLMFYYGAKLVSDESHMIATVTYHNLDPEVNVSTLVDDIFVEDKLTYFYQETTYYGKNYYGYQAYDLRLYFNQNLKLKYFDNVSKTAKVTLSLAYYINNEYIDTVFSDGVYTKSKNELKFDKFYKIKGLFG